jgi:ABC-type branched-subunit amino acid transport system ATPase component
MIMALLGRIRRSGVGRVTIAVRDNPTTAASYTVRPGIAKMRAFALAGAIAGLGGGLLAGVAQQINFGDPRFLVDGSLTLVAMVVIGGMGSIMGAVVGAVWVVGLPTLTPGNAVVPLLTSSMGLLILLLYFPGGLVDIAHKTRSAIYRRLEAKLPPLEKTASAPATVLHRSARDRVDHEMPLRATDVSVSFGGVRANDRVSIEVRSNEIVGLIGTNGAGKTTLMNAIGGFVHARGRIELLGLDVSHDQPAVRARRGLGRTFQAATLFPELTVRETVEVALEAHGRSGLVETALFSPRARRRSRTQRSEAAELINFLGLGRYGDRPISELSTGTRRIVELAGLLALDARVLCLDEPTAGIAQREAEAMGPLLVEIRKELGASMLIIEHDMPLIMGMSDRVYCLELGRVIAEGPPAMVRNDPAVIASYLGMDESTIQRSGQAAVAGSDA